MEREARNTLSPRLKSVHCFFLFLFHYAFVRNLASTEAREQEKIGVLRTDYLQLVSRLKLRKIHVVSSSSLI